MNKRYIMQQEESVSPDDLRKELTTAIGPYGWAINTSGVVVDFLYQDVSVEIDMTKVDQVIQSHFSGGAAREAKKLINNIINLVQSTMDAKANEFGYDDIKSAVTYADEPAVTKFQDEGKAFRQWRSLMWAKCYEIQTAVLRGERPMPTEAEVLAELPQLVLP